MPGPDVQGDEALEGAAQQEVVAREPWPHQTYGVSATLDAIREGYRVIALTTPTGGGKTYMMEMLARWFIGRGERVSLYTNRRGLVQQVSDDMAAAGIAHGVRAAGHDDERGEEFQISSVHTELARCVNRPTWELHRSKLVLVDEGHNQMGPKSRKIWNKHLESGAAVVLVTATPIGFAGFAQKLIVAGTNSELRQCGALVLAKHYGPDEPDTRSLRIRDGEPVTEQQAVKAMSQSGLVGRIWEWFGRLNPDRRPTITFAPGVAESLWIAEEFTRRGARAAHIDGNSVWVDGEWYHNDVRGEVRREVLADSKCGRIVVLCNRFVFREGINAPWLSHGILATILSSVGPYLQALGRLLRSAPGKDEATIQDHGGNWHRYGSVNADRLWHLDMTSQMAYCIRADSIRYKRCAKCRAPLETDNPTCVECDYVNQREPWTCPKCAKINEGWRCQCGYSIKGQLRSRPLVTQEGTLIQMRGDIFRPPPISKQKDGPAKWRQMYYRSLNARGGRSFRAAAALFAAENNWQYPDPGWPLMPTTAVDWYRKVSDVPFESLTQRQR